MTERMKRCPNWACWKLSKKAQQPLTADLEHLWKDSSQKATSQLDKTAGGDGGCSGNVDCAMLKPCGSWEETRRLCGSRPTLDQTVCLSMTWSPLPTQQTDWTCRSFLKDSASIRDDRKRMEPTTRCLAQLDEQGKRASECLTGGARAKLHDVDCHSLHSARIQAGLQSKRKVVVAALAMDNRTAPRADVDAWRHPRHLHIQLDPAIVDTRANTPRLHQQQRKQREQKQPGTVQRRLAGVTGVAMQVTERDGVDRTWTPCSDALRAFRGPYAAQRSKTVTDRCKNGANSSVWPRPLYSRHSSLSSRE